MSLFRNAAELLLSRAFGVVVGLVGSILLARFLSVEDRGLYSVAMTFAGIVVILTQLGWPPASIYRLRRIGSNPADVATAGLVTFVSVSAIAIPICIAFEPFFTERFFDGAPSLVFYLAVAIVPFELFPLLFGALARGIDRFRIQVWYRVLYSVASLATIAVVLVLQQGSLIRLMAALLAAQALLAIGFGVATLRHTGISFRFNGSEIRDSLRFGFKSYVQALAGRIHERIDIFMLAYLLSDPEQVAYYAIAASLVDRLKMVPDTIRNAVYPELAGSPETPAATLACRMSRQSITAVLATMVALAACGPYLVPLVYGSPYAASIAPMLVLLPGMALFTMYRILSAFFTAINRQSPNILTQVVSVAFNVGLNLYLIPRFGILGAAGASLASYALEATLISAVFMRVTKKGVGELVLTRREDLEPLRRRFSLLLQRLRASARRR